MTKLRKIIWFSLPLLLLNLSCENRGFKSATESSEESVETSESRESESRPPTSVVRRLPPSDASGPEENPASPAPPAQPPNAEENPAVPPAMPPSNPPPVTSGAQIKLEVDANHFNPNLPESQRWLEWGTNEAEEIFISREYVDEPQPLKLTFRVVNTSTSLSMQWPIISRPSHFIISSSSLTSIPPRGSATFTVSIDVASKGVKREVVSLTHGAARYSVKLKGEVRE